MRTLITASLVLALAGAAAADPLEDALAKCVPGASYTDCVHALQGAGAKLQNQGTEFTEVDFNLQPPFGGIGVRTYPGAAGRIVLVDFVISADAGKPRKVLLDWLGKQVGTRAKRARSGAAGQGCGAAGWGVGWVASPGTEPEVQIQLDSPESPSPDDLPEKHKPDDALLKRQGNGMIDVCFVLPPTSDSFVGTPAHFIAAPVLSPGVMKAFLASPSFHGIAKLQ